MRKLPNELENPFDNLVYVLVERISPLFYHFGLTPNSITSLSLLCGIYSAYLLFKKCYFLSILFYLLAYIFDCLDGYNARKYNMMSKFGDYYDHISDIFKFLLLVIVFYLQNKKLFWFVFPIIIIDSIFVMIHLGCQESYYNKNDSETLSFLGICPKDKSMAKKILRWSRYLGTGTSTLMIIFFIIVYALFN